METLETLNPNLLEQIQTKVCVHNMIWEMPKNHYSLMMRKISDFGKAMEASNQSSFWYSSARRASNASEDIKIGKYGEMAALYGLISCGFPKAEIDFEIRQNSKKGWQVDLPFKESNPLFKNCHVKTCYSNTVDYVGEYSWTFQLKNANGNPGGRDPLIDHPECDELVVMMYIKNLVYQEVQIVATAPWNRLYKILRPPKAKKLEGCKACIYVSEVIELAKKDGGVRLYPL